MSEKVFVSSSQKDLIKYRESMREALLSMHLTPMMMEYFEANRTTGTKTSLDYVDESDIFLLIVGWRYGLPPPGQQVSVTEMEYDAALATAMPILVFLVEKGTRDDPAHFDFDPAGINTNAVSTDPQDQWTWQQLSAKLDAFRQRLKTAHICKEFSSVQQLRIMVSEDMHVTIQKGVKGPRLLRGAGAAMLSKDYAMTQQLAQETLEALPVGSTTPEVQFTAAQARYLLALALLRGQAPSTIAHATFRAIEALLEQCINLLPARGSYRYVLGEICQKVGQGPFPSLVQKGTRLVQEAYALPTDEIDRQNIAYYEKAKP